MAAIGVDFDGVLHRYSRGWADGTIYDPPVDGALEALDALCREYAVFVHTCRAPRQAAVWLRGHGVQAYTAEELLTRGYSLGLFWDYRSLILVTNRKYPAVAYIDDRAIRFTDWPQALRELGETRR